MFGIKSPKSSSSEVLSELVARLTETMEHPLYQITKTTKGPSFLAVTAAGIAAGLASKEGDMPDSTVAKKSFRIARDLEKLILEHEAALKESEWMEYSGSCPDEGCSGGVVRGWCDQCGEGYRDKIQEP